MSGHAAPTHTENAMPLELGFDAYRSAVCQAVVALHVRSEQPDRFRGSLSAGGSGDVHVLGIAADVHSVTRTPGLIQRGERNLFKFTVIESGSGLVVQDGRETALAAGDMTIYDTARPYSLLLDEQVRMSVVMFPHELIGLPPAALSPLTATRLTGDSALQGIARSTLASVASRLPDTTPGVARHLCRGAMGLVEAVLESCISSVGPQSESAAFRRALDYIEDHLTDPHLGPGTIARGSFVSLRTLHGLFAAQGTTVSTVVRIRRLERSYDALLAVRNAGRPIAAIAADHCFSDAAHFSRAFRAHFGFPPRSLPRPGG